MGAMNDPEKKAIALLDFLITTNGLSLRDVDNKCGYARGTMGNLLNRRTRLRFNQIFEILGACNVEPKTFFSALFPPDPPVRQVPVQRTLHQELMEVAERASLRDAGGLRGEDLSSLMPIPADVSLRPEDLVRMIEQRVLKALEQQRVMDSPTPEVKRTGRRPAPRRRRKPAAG